MQVPGIWVWSSIIILITLFGCGGKEEKRSIFQQKSTAKAPALQKTSQGQKSHKSVLSKIVEINPFLTPEERAKFKEKREEKTIVIDYLNLSAIFFSPQGSYAVINNQIFKEGESIDNKRIEKIERERVVLKDDTGKYSLVLSDIRNIK